MNHRKARPCTDPRRNLMRFGWKPVLTSRVIVVAIVTAHRVPSTARFSSWSGSVHRTYRVVSSFQDKYGHFLFSISLERPPSAA